MTLAYSSIGLTNVVYAVALTDGSRVRLMFYLPYLLLLECDLTMTKNCVIAHLHIYVVPL